MFVQNKTFMSRPNAVFSAGWRDSVRSARDPRARQAANAIESSQRRLERKMAEQDVICMNLNHSSHALIAANKLNWQRHLSVGHQRHEQHRFEAELVRNYVKRPCDQLVETRNPPTMNIAGRLDGLGCEWFSPLADPVKPFPMPKEAPYPTGGVSLVGMKPMARPLPKILTAHQRLNLGVDA